MATTLNDAARIAYQALAEASDVHPQEFEQYVLGQVASEFFDATQAELWDNIQAVIDNNDPPNAPLYYAWLSAQAIDTEAM